MAWLIYIIGVLLSVYLCYKIILKEEGEIRFEHIITFCLCLFSWIMLIVITICYVDKNKNKVIYKPKNKKDGLGKNN